MAEKRRVEFTTPVGRLVWGSVHEAQQKKDEKGQAKLIATGADKGKELWMFDFGVAIPKTQQHWGNEPDWGQKIWAEGHASFPGGQTQRPDFSWKVIDGDSTIPNTKGKRPADQEHNRGHWILAFSGMSAPEIWSSANGAPMRDNTPNLIQPGDEVQVFGSVTGNGSDLKPGVYLNHAGVCWRGQSRLGRISLGPQVDPSGFGAGLAPGATASAQPLANAIPGAPPAPGGITPPAPGAVPPTPTVPGTPPTPGVAPAAAPVPVAPSAAYTPTGVVPPAPGAVPTPPVPPAPAGPVMTAKAIAANLTYEALRNANWTDDQMRAEGYIA